MVPVESVETLHCSGLINSLGFPVLSDKNLNERISHIVHQKIHSRSDKQFIVSYKVVNESATLKKFRIITLKIKNFLFNKDLYLGILKILALPAVLALCLLVPAGYFYLGTLGSQDVNDNLTLLFLLFMSFAPQQALTTFSYTFAYPLYFTALFAYKMSMQLGGGAIENFKKVMAKTNHACFSDYIKVKIASKPSPCHDFEVESILNKRIGPDHEPLLSCRDPISAQTIQLSDIKHPKYIRLGRYITDIKSIIRSMFQSETLAEEKIKHPFIADRPLSNDEQSEIFDQVSDFFAVPSEAVKKFFFYKLSPGDRLFFADQADVIELNIKKRLFKKFLAKAELAYFNQINPVFDQPYISGYRKPRYDSLLIELDIFD